MKLSLFPLLSGLPLLALSIAVAACSSDPAPDAPPTTNPSPTATTDPPPPAGPPARKLVTKSFAPTPAENLLVDPNFQSLWSPIDETGFGIYESFVQEADRGVRFEPRTPAGPSAPVLSVRPAFGEGTLTMTVLGGKGPLTVRVWVSVPAKGDEPTIELVSLYDDSSVTLKPEEGTRTKIDDTEWVELTGASSGDMPGMLYLVATIAKDTRFVAPRVVSAMLPPKNALPSRGTNHPSARATNAARAFDALRSRYVTKSRPPAVALPARAQARAPARPVD